MPLQSLQIRNYQRHANLTIRLAPGCTTLTGASDKGKSSILRALRWLTLGKPVGHSFIRRGSKQVAVALWLDGKRIIRQRGKTNAGTYTIGEHIYNVPQGVPAPVAALLNLSPLNFQSQHDGPYWFGSSPPEVARQLNAIVDLGAIDTTLQYLGQQITRRRAEAAVCTARLAAAQTEADSLGYVDKLDKDLSALEALAADMALKRTRAAAVASVVKIIQTQGAAAKARQAQAQAVAELLVLAGVALDARQAVDDLWGICETVDQYEKDVAITGDNAQQARKRLRLSRGPTSRFVIRCGEMAYVPDTEKDYGDWRQERDNLSMLLARLTYHILKGNEKSSKSIATQAAGFLKRYQLQPGILRDV